MNGKFFKCECGSEGLYVKYDCEAYTEISMFSRSPEDRSWHNRLKLAIAALKGKPYIDMVLLSDQTLADLVDHLADIQNFDQVEVSSEADEGWEL